MISSKKVAFLIYPMFCNYEVALTLSSLEMEGKEVVVFAKDKKPVLCEEGLIASNSISPTLLARAGLLKGKKFCVGMFEEAREQLDFFDYENLQRAPIVIDGNIITAMGMAFREFAIAITRKLGYECSDERWSAVKYPINPDDYIFRATD